MINVKREEIDGIIHLTIAGEVDEKIDFDKELGSLAGDVRINCRNIHRISSHGIKGWRQYFQKVRADGKAKIRFVELSPVLISTAGYLVDFILLSEIESCLCPFACIECGKSTLKAFSLAEIEDFATRLEVPNTQCESCGESAEFDELAEEYFAFAAKR